MPRGRTILTIAACLLGGMVINVLVAWGVLVLHAKYPNLSVRSTHTTGAFTWPMPMPSGWPAVASEQQHHRLLGVTLHRFAAVHGSLQQQQGTNVRQTHQFTGQKSGWPLRSMACYQVWTMEVSLQHSSAMFYDGAWNRLSRGRFLPIWASHQWPAQGWFMKLPLLPITAGFITNTLIYASVLWLAFVALGVLRTSRRRRRGQCLACGYDLAALPRCPECGTVPLTRPALRTSQCVPACAFTCTAAPKSESRGTIVPRLPPR